MGSSPIQVATRSSLDLFRWLFFCKDKMRCGDLQFFGSLHLRDASVAQSVEQGTENPRVDGSIPSGGTTFFERFGSVFRRCCRYADLAHLVERHLAKVEVAGSSPVIRSSFARANQPSTRTICPICPRQNFFIIYGKFVGAIVSAFLIFTEQADISIAG